MLEVSPFSQYIFIQECIIVEIKKIYSWIVEHNEVSNLFPITENISNNRSESNDFYANRKTLRNVFTSNKGVLTGEDYLNKEISKYLQIGFEIDEKIEKFWLRHKESLPRMYQVAKVLLSLLPSSASAERIFKVGKVVKEIGHNTSDELTRKRIFIATNKHLKISNFDF